MHGKLKAHYIRKNIDVSFDGYSLGRYCHNSHVFMIASANIYT